MLRASFPWYDLGLKRWKPGLQLPIEFCAAVQGLERLCSILSGTQSGATAAKQDEYLIRHALANYFVVVRGFEETSPAQRADEAQNQDRTGRGGASPGNKHNKQKRIGRERETVEKKKKRTRNEEK